MKLSAQQEEDLFTAQPLSSNDFSLGNADLTTSLPSDEKDYADPAAASYVDNNNIFDITGLDPGEVGTAVSSSSSFSVADSNLDMLQSSCGGGGGSTTAAGKLRARDETFCQNQDAPSAPPQLQPNIFDTLPSQPNVLDTILSQPNVFNTPLLPDAVSPLRWKEEEDAKSVDAVLVDDSKKKCRKAPYIVNLCCNGPPIEWWSVAQIWATVEKCSLCKKKNFFFLPPPFPNCSFM